MQILYEGIFFDDKNSNIIRSLDFNKLNRKINDLHITFKHAPSEDEIFNELLGKEFDIELIGYGNDGQNSGFQVRLTEELIEYYINTDNEEIRTPHITTTLSNDAKANNTHKLSFKPFNKAIKIKGIFSLYIQDKNNDYISTIPETTINIKKR